MDADDDARLRLIDLLDDGEGKTAMREVFLNVYDVTTSGSERTNNTISTLNGITYSLGLGGVFHGAVEVCGEEWSFGFCEDGSGVYACPPRKNPLYTYRESISLGITRKSPEEVGGIGCGEGDVTAGGGGCRLLGF